MISDKHVFFCLVPLFSRKCQFLQLAGIEVVSPPASSLLGPVACLSLSAVVVLTLGGGLRLEVEAGVAPGCEGQSRRAGVSVVSDSVSRDGRSVSPTHSPSTSPPSRSAAIQL